MPTSTDSSTVEAWEAQADPAEDHPQQAARRSRRRTVLLRLIQLAILAIFLGSWQYMGSTSRTLELAISTPARTAQWMWSWATDGSIPHGNGWSDLYSTLKTAFFGYLLGAGSGVVLGALFGSARMLRLFAAPFIAMLNAFPKISLAPLFLVIFGTSLEMRMYFVASVTFFITFFAVYNGLLTINPTYVRNVRMLGGNLLWRAWLVYLPSILGWLVAGLRLTAAWSISSAVIVEYLASNAGMGYVVGFGQQTGNVPQTIGGLIVVSIVALFVDRLLIRAGNRLTSWRTR